MTVPFSEVNPDILDRDVPPANVVVEDFVFDDEQGRYLDDGENKSILDDWVILNRYEKDLHRYMLGITSPGGFNGESVAFVQIAAPTLLWIAEWTMSRYGSQCPPYPSPALNNPDWVLLDEHYEEPDISASADGITGLYRISGVYVFGKRTPNADTNKDMSFPRPPNLEDVFDRTVPDNAKTKNLIENVGAGGGNAKRIPV